MDTTTWLQPPWCTPPLELAWQHRCINHAWLTLAWHRQPEPAPMAPSTVKPAPMVDRGTRGTPTRLQQVYLTTADLPT